MVATQSPPPDRLGPYRLLERIGAGGMGVVYLARDGTGGVVAVKVLRPHAVAEEPEARRRLAREVETMRRVHSPHVAEVIDADVTGPDPYIVTRYVPGRGLDEVVGAEGPLPPRELERLAYGLAEALAAVHAAGVVHRDLKPGNVLLTSAGPVVIDFGIARTPDSTRLTQTGMFIGTPGYLAPEVIEGEPNGTSSDVHSWGATVAFAATGRPPFGGGPFDAIFYRIVRGQADLAGIREPLLSLVSAAMTRNPRGRPTASWLCARCAAGAGWAAAGARGGIADGSGGAAGARGPVGSFDAGPVAGGFDGTRMLPDRRDPGEPGGTRMLPDRPDVGDVSRDVADLLPPARYQPAWYPSPGQPEPADVSAALSPSRAGYRGERPHRLLGLAASVLAVGVSLMLPIAGTLAAVAAIVVLRAGDRVHRLVSGRNASRGADAADPLAVVAAAPWALGRSLLTTVLLAPITLAAAAVGAIVAAITVRTDTLAYVGAYAAAALVACYAVGPGSRGPRRQLARTFDAITRSRGSAAVTALVVCCLAAGALLAAMAQPPLFWPSPAGLVPHVHVPPIAGLFGLSQLRLPHLGLPNSRLPNVSQLFGRLPAGG